MADEDDAFPLAGQIGHDFKQAVTFLGKEYGCGFVENQHIRARIQKL